jgi:hypothetical protein
LFIVLYIRFTVSFLTSISFTTLFTALFTFLYCFTLYLSIVYFVYFVLLFIVYFLIFRLFSYIYCIFWLHQSLITVHLLHFDILLIGLLFTSGCLVACCPSVAQLASVARLPVVCCLPSVACWLIASVAWLPGCCLVVWLPPLSMPRLVACCSVGLPSVVCIVVCCLFSFVGSCRSLPVAPVGSLPAPSAFTVACCLLPGCLLPVVRQG